MTHKSLSMPSQGNRDLGACYKHCQQIARHSNFYRGLTLLPVRKRLALAAVYAFLRHCDDISDDEGAPDRKDEQLAQVRRDFDHAMESGHTEDPILWALRDTIHTFQIPVLYFHQVIDGTVMDLTTSRYSTFDDLSRYCYLVASVVGLICIEIFGYKDVAAQKYAIACGIAFQLTNILRDLHEDIERDRVYLPQEDLNRFAYFEADIRNKIVDERFRSLMGFQVQRAKEYYEEARPLAGLLDRASRPAFRAMLESYRTLLLRIELRGFDVFQERVRLQPADFWRIAARSLTRW